MNGEHERSSFRERREELGRLASAHRGMVLTNELQARFSRSEIRSMQRYGHITPWYPGVWAVGHVPREQRATWDAIRASRGAHVAISHGAAAYIHGFWTMPGAPRLHLTSARNVRAVGGEVVHRSRTLRAVDVVMVDGSTVTSAERTVIDLCDLFPAQRVARMMYEADYHGLLDSEILADQVERARGRRSFVAAGDAVAMRNAGNVGSRSTFEDRVDDRLALAGILPAEKGVIVSTKCRDYEVDRAWPDHGIVLEANGFPHWRPASRREDQARIRAIERTGRTVIVVTEDDLGRTDEWFQDRFPMA